MWKNQKFVCCFPALLARSFSVFKMPHVAVRSVNTEEHMMLCFSYGGKQRSMKRGKLELLEKTLQRMRLTLFKNKKKSKPNESNRVLEMTEIKVGLFEDGKQIEEQTLNAEAWKDGRVLKIGEVDYTVEVNPPTVTVLSIPNCFMAGFPVFPVVEVEFAEKQLCQFRWFKSKSPISDSAEKSSVNHFDDGDSVLWQNVSNEFIYTPSIGDIGCYLKLECVPLSMRGREGHMRMVTSNAAVSAGPGSSPFDERHLYTSCRLEGNEEFRVLSYNILADTYATGEFAENYLFPYCPKYALDIQYRKQLLLKEIIGYNADIICLQECGKTIYQQMLQPALEMMGYYGMLQCKAGEIPEGEAIFFRLSKFQFVEQHNIVFKEAIVSDELHEEISKTVSNIKPLFESLQRRGQVGQVTVLRCAEKPNHFLCIANTHLYFKPYSPHIRLIQSGVLLKHVEDVVGHYVSHENKFASQTQKYTDDTKNVHVASGFSHESVSSEYKVDHSNCKYMAVLFCGDFNSNPSAAVKQLFTEGRVTTSHPDWTICEEKDQHITTLELSHNFNLSSACDSLPFTNYTTGYKGTLDYIFSDANYLKVKSVVPVPEESTLDAHIGLPSVVMPSDHLALVCDLKWKNTIF